LLVFPELILLRFFLKNFYFLFVFENKHGFKSSVLMHLIFTVLQLNLIQQYLLINDNSLAHSQIIEVYL